MSDTPWIANTPADAQEGSASEFRARIDSIALQDDSRILTPWPGVTAIVGGNNVGKSTVLRNVRDQVSMHIGHQYSGWQLVKRVGLERSGSPGDLIAWLGEHAEYLQKGNQYGFQSAQAVVRPEDALNAWRSAPDARLGHLVSFVLYYADASGRLSLANAADQREDIGDPPVHPLHHLQDSEALLEEVQRLSSEIFRQPLTLDRLSRKVSLRTGSIDVETPRVDAVTTQYRDALKHLPHLYEQGDGMRSLLGLLLPLITATHQIVLVDEPEAFLHPPQARALGTALAALAEQRNLQIILATHDRNIVTGLLEAQGVDVSVARLSRKGDVTTSHQLDADELRQIWSDPVLRYSNALDGLFHRLVVIAEADQDCRFYNAALEAAHEQDPLNLVPGEVLFVPSGGKAGMAKLASALRAVEVDVVVTPDLDALNDDDLIRGIVRSVGGDWETYESDYSRATANFRVERSLPTCGDVLTAINAAFEGREDDLFDSVAKRDLSAQIRLRESPWKALKDFGDRAFKGEAAVAAKSLMDALDELGIVLVRVGELENFASLGVSKGPAWLAAALETEAYKDDDVVQHVRRLVDAVA